MHVSDMTGPRRQILQREVISTKHPILLTMMDLTTRYPMGFQLEIHTWVQIHQVMNFTIFIQLNMFHQCQLDTNFSLDFPSQIKVQNHFQRKKPNKDGLVLFLPAHIYGLLSQEVKDALQKYNAEAIQKFKSTRNLHEINFQHDLHQNTQFNSTTSNQDDQSLDYQ